MRTRLGEVELADWNRAFAVNTTGALQGIQALAPLMPSGSAIAGGRPRRSRAHSTRSQRRPTVSVSVGREGTGQWGSERQFRQFAPAAKGPVLSSIMAVASSRAFSTAR